MAPDVAEVRGASRTDAGVHARGQRVAFESERAIPPRGWALGLAKHLPPAIGVRAAARVEAGYVPRFASQGKRYVYTWLRDPLRDPFLENRAWRIDGSLDVDAMRDETTAAIGTHDFAAFRSSADERTSTVRTIRRLDVVQPPEDPRLLLLVVEGDGFLHNMVRILAGSLADVGLRRLAKGAFSRALATGVRTDLGRTAPAHGLLLDEVFLASEGEERWPPLSGAATPAPSR